MSAHLFVLCNKSNAKVGAGVVDWSRGESSEVDGDQLVFLEFRPLSTALGPRTHTDTQHTVTGECVHCCEWDNVSSNNCYRGKPF